MKRYGFYIAAALIIAQIINQSCKSSGSFKFSPADTTQQLMAYIDKDSIRTIWVGYRIIKDTPVIKGRNVDWGKDTAYYVLGNFPILTPAGQTIKDTAGKDLIRSLYYPIPSKNIVRDGDFRKFNVDSFLKAKK